MRKFGPVLASFALALSACSQEPATPIAHAPAEPSASAQVETQPISIQQVAQTASADPDAPDLDAWVQDPVATQEVRYASLRELERRDPPRALSAAKVLLQDPGTNTFLRQNAIAVIARLDTPAALAALKGLSPEERALAARLAARKAH